MLVLVTGAAGFIGSHLAERLLALGGEVVGLDNFDAGYAPEIKRRNLRGALACGPAFRLVEGDVRDARLLGELFAEKRFDAVLHLAAHTGIRRSLEDPLGCAEVNAGGSLALLEAARAGGVRRLVLASSSSVYGENTSAPFREDAPCDRPLSPYAASKRAMEHYAAAYSRLHGLDVTCLRYFPAYGPRGRPDLAVHKFARLIEEDRPVPVYGDGSSARDYTYVGDVVDGTLAALHRLKGFEICNLGAGRPVRLDELIALLEKALGRKARVERMPAQPGELPLSHADLTKSRRQLGYAPAVSLEAGLRRFVQWLRAGEPGTG
jgi:UDP-glucuronate 4-epimerase